METVKQPHYDLDRLRRISISRVASLYGPLRRSGCRQVTHCPWHEDNHPSLTLYEGMCENRCHCFACGNGGSVIDYVMQQEQCSFQEACRIVAGIGGIIADDQTNHHWHRPAVRQVQEPHPTPSTTHIPLDWVTGHMSEENALSQCLLQLFDSYKVRYITEEYMLGCLGNEPRPDDVLFPTIDFEGHVRNVKVQRYETDIRSPRFAKSDKHCCYWIGQRLVKEGIVEKGAHFDNDCLFGAHLLKRHPQAMVVLVESPKNAICGAVCCPQYVWVATGNKTMLKRNVLQPLKNRKVLVYPDHDAFEEWSARLDTMRDIATFTVSNLCELSAPDDEPKYDIADHIISTALKARQGF